MQTTNLFVELLLIGIGAAIWIFFFLLFWGIDVQAILRFLGENQIIGAGFSIAILYILGIVTDRFADRLFDKEAKKHLNTYFESYDDLLVGRVTLYQAASPLVENLNYGRSRMRICRGWLFNLILIFLLGNIYFLINTQWKLVAFLTVCCVVLGYGFYFAWKNLIKKEYSKIMKISKLLKK